MVSTLTLMGFVSAQLGDERCCLLTSPVLRVSASGKSTITGSPVRLQGPVGEWGGMQLEPYPPALTYSPKKIQP